MLKDRSATALGPIGLILPTFAQDITPSWAAPPFAGAQSRSGLSPDEEEPASDPLETLVALCRESEDLGAGALWACDHLFWHGPCLECLTTLTVAATATERARLGTCVMQLPLRQAAVVAKQAATLQTLTAGRLILGVGAGSHAGEYEQAGVDYHTRGRRLDEGIARAAPVLVHRAGESRRVTPRQPASERYRQLPEPLPVPVWVGGSSEAALRRAARLGDGWMPLFVKPAEYRDALDRLAKEVDRAEREAGSVTPVMVLFVSVDDDPATARQRGTAWMSSFYGIPAKAFERHLVSGTAGEVADVVSRLPRRRRRARRRLRDRRPSARPVRTARLGAARRPASPCTRVTRRRMARPYTSWAPPSRP